MRSLFLTLREVVLTGLLRGWPGMRCPECKVRPGKMHNDECSGRRLGEYWG